jgi:hypothetical protein
MESKARVYLLTIVCAAVSTAAGAVNASAHTSVAASPSSGNPGSLEQIRNVIKEYATSVDNLDLKLAAQIWPSGAEVASSNFVERRGD